MSIFVSAWCSNLLPHGIKTSDCFFEKKNKTKKKHAQHIDIRSFKYVPSC